jgi:hypothetical protein
MQKDNLLHLLYYLKKQKFNIVLYTGYELDEIPETIINFLDYIKTGRFIISQKTTIQQFVGSKNQNFIKLN